MHILQVTEDYKEHWDNFVKTNAGDGGLLHSWQWGEFQRALDNKVFRLGLIDGDGQFQAAALLVKNELQFEYNYLYCPRGPVINVLKINDLKSLLTEIKKIAHDEKSFLVRVDPPWTEGNQQLLTAAGFRKGDKEVQPKCVLFVDLGKTVEELSGELKQKVRYNVNLAKKHGVTVRVSGSIADIEPFWQLTKQTASRDGFTPHPKEHYKKMFEFLSAEGLAKLFVAEYENEVIAVNLVTFYGRVATYLHGASSNICRDVMAPYLLQWEAMMEAKRLGFSYYDLGGINGQTFYNEKWSGITRFKSGFSTTAKPIEYVGSYEKVINPVIYSVYKFIKQIRGLNMARIKN